MYVDGEKSKGQSMLRDGFVQPVMEEYRMHVCMSRNNMLLLQYHVYVRLHYNSHFCPSKFAQLQNSSCAMFMVKGEGASLEDEYEVLEDEYEATEPPPQSPHVAGVAIPKTPQLLELVEELTAQNHTATEELKKLRSEEADKTKQVGRMTRRCKTVTQ